MSLLLVNHFKLHNLFFIWKWSLHIKVVTHYIDPELEVTDWLDFRLLTTAQRSVLEKHPEVPSSGWMTSSLSALLNMWHPAFQTLPLVYESKKIVSFKVAEHFLSYSPKTAVASHLGHSPLSKHVYSLLMLWSLQTGNISQILKEKKPKCFWREIASFSTGIVAGYRWSPRFFQK